MVKMNIKKIKDTTKQLKCDNYSIDKRYRSVICCFCSIPATHVLVTGLDCYPEFCEDLICNVCADSIQKLSNYEWDDQGIIGLYELM